MYPNNEKLLTSNSILNYICEYKKELKNFTRVVTFKINMHARMRRKWNELGPKMDQAILRMKEQQNEKNKQ